MTLSKMTTYTKNDEQIIQNAKLHQENIQKILNAKNAKAELTMTFEVSETTLNLQFDTKSQKGFFLSHKPLDTELRPRLKSSGLKDPEIDIIFGFFFQNFIVPQMVYEALLLEKNAAPNSNYYLANYENVLFAYHYWMDQSEKAEKKELLFLVPKILEKVKNPASKDEIFSIYIAENQSLIESNFIHWMFLQAYILNDISEYEVHTSFGDYIGYLLEDLK